MEKDGIIIFLIAERLENSIEITKSYSRFQKKIIQY